MRNYHTSLMALFLLTQTSTSLAEIEAQCGQIFIKPSAQVFYIDDYRPAIPFFDEGLKLLIFIEKATASISNSIAQSNNFPYTKEQFQRIHLNVTLIQKQIKAFSEIKNFDSDLLFILNKRQDDLQSVISKTKLYEVATALGYINTATSNFHSNGYKKPLEYTLMTELFYIKRITEASINSINNNTRTHTWPLLSLFRGEKKDSQLPLTIDSQRTEIFQPMIDLLTQIRETTPDLNTTDLTDVIWTCKEITKLITSEYFLNSLKTYPHIQQLQQEITRLKALIAIISSDTHRHLR